LGLVAMWLPSWKICSLPSGVSVPLFCGAF
jgi:hypothetical protein